jgi:ferredoxin like protein
MDVNIKAKLGKNTFKADAEKHIKVKPEICKNCRTKVCLYVCPAHVYSLDKEGVLVLELDGCLECGTCKIACVNNALDWNYPHGGFGVQYKYG